LLSNVYRPGVVGLAKTLSTQVAAEGITINNVAPGYTRTDRVLELAQARAAKEGKTVDEVVAETAAAWPMKRMGEPEELAALVAFLASERAGYITGTTIAVDGGSVKGLL
jgi:3-oxoacyl-[acyl-carrier protein] reductase